MKRARVLVVEDDALIMLGLCDLLELACLEVVGTAANVTDALRLAETARPDLALFDVDLIGRPDGIEGARLLRRRFGLPVVFLTGDPEREIRKKISDLEPVACLMKPAHPKQLIAAIETTLERQYLGREACVSTERDPLMPRPVLR